MLTEVTTRYLDEINVDASAQTPVDAERGRQGKVKKIWKESLLEKYAEE